LYASPNIVREIKSRRVRGAGHIAQICEMRNAYNILVGRPEGNGRLGIPRRRLEDNIRMDRRENRVRGCGLDSSGSG
jgi:hypothetical protein